MKTLLRYLVLVLLFCMHPAQAQQAESLEEIQKQLLGAIKKDIDANPDWEEGKMSAARRYMQMVSDVRPGAIDFNQVRQIQTHGWPGLFSESTDHIIKTFRERVTTEIEARKKKIVGEYREKVRGYLTRAVAKDKPEEITAIRRELMTYWEETMRLDNQALGNNIASSSGVHTPQAILDNLVQLHSARLREDWAKVGLHLGNLENTAKNSLEPYVPVKELTEFVAKMRSDIGFTPPEDFEGLYQKLLNELLDDANQDRIEELRTSIQKYRILSVSPDSSSSSPSARWQRMDMFASALLQAVQRVKEGGIPQISVESWTRSDSNYQALLSKDKLVEALGGYRVKVSMEDGKVNEERLYYAVGELSDVFTEILAEVLDDANQDRLDEIRVRAQVLQKFSSSGTELQSVAQRFQQLGSFVQQLNQAVQRVKEGGIPQISIESWTRNDSGYQSLLKKEKLVEALGKYRVKVRTDEGRVNEVRLYYSIGELRDASTEILAEVLNDANQDRLDEIRERTQILQKFSSSGTEMQTVAQRFQQLGSLVQQLEQAVLRTKEGGLPRLNPDELLRSGSESGRLIEKKKLVELLKKYRVKMTDLNGKEKKEPLYQEVDDIVARINTLDDIENEMRTLALISRSSSYESGQVNIGQAVAALTALAELHANMKKGDSFVLQSQQSSVMNDGTVRSWQPDPADESLLASRLRMLRNEAERAVLKRMIAGVEIDESSSRNEVMVALRKKFVAAGNYQAVLALGRVTAYFEPKQPLVSLYELQAVQSYVDGVRQQEELGEPRLATGHYQRAAATRSSIIPVEELRKRLHQLRQEHAEAYEKGTDDAMSSERSMVLYAQPPLVVPSR